ncbi:hypothetical protein GCM10009624_01200 [Gordonia sinesedis]
MTIGSVVLFVIIGLAGLGVAGAIWQRPQRGILLLAALTPFNGMTVLLPAGMVPAGWKEALLLFTLLVALIRCGSLSVRGLGGGWWPAALALVIFGVVSAFVTFGVDGLVPIKITFIYILVALTIWRAPFTASDRDRLVTIMITVGLINAVYGIAQQFIGVSSLVDLGYVYGNEVRNAGPLLRSFGTFNQPFPYGLFLMVTILVALAVSLNDPHRWRSRLVFWTLPLLIVAMSLSVVRASYLGLVTGLLFMGFVRYRAFLARIALPVVGTVALAVYLLPSSVLSTFVSSDSYATRSGGWTFVWNTIITHPLGEGLGMTGSAGEKLATGSVQLPETLRDRIDGATAFAYGMPYQPDNYYIKLLFELGPLGLWLFLMILVTGLVTSVRVARRAEPSDSALAVGIGAVIAAAAAASVVSTYFEIFPLDVYFWMLLGVLAGIPTTRHSSDDQVAQAQTAVRPTQGTAVLPPKGVRLS